MSYIGNSLTQQSFTGGVDQFNGNASNTAFGLTRTINTNFDVDVYVENVWQRPGVGYSVSANTITFTSAPSAGSRPRAAEPRPARGCRSGAARWRRRRSAPRARLAPAAKASAAKTSSRVAGRKTFRSSQTGRRVSTDCPQSPCSRPVA